MSTLAQLKAYLLTLPFVERDRFEAEQFDGAELVPSLTLVDELAETYLLYREVYPAVLYFERWVHPKEVLLSHITSWLLEYGGRRDEDELGFPIIEPLRNDDDTFDIMVTVMFSESVYIQPADDGDLLINNRRWKRVLLLPVTAETVAVNGS